MGNLFSRRTTSVEEVKEQRNARVEYQNYLTRVQTNTTTDVRNQKLTPESGQEVLTRIQQALDWLDKNPNASFNEVLAKRDSTSADIDRILKTDAPKRELKNQIDALPTIADALKTNNIITESDKTKLEALAKEQLRWFEKNQKTATVIALSQESIKLNDQVQTILVETPKVQRVREELQKVKDLAPGEVASLTAQEQTRLIELKNINYGAADAVQDAKSIAVKTVLILVLVFACLLAGSLAANAAIGRYPVYRILYFIYGCIPIFAPFVYIYTILQRINNGRLPYYAVLPLTIEPATTTLGKFFLWPFYWVPDADAVAAHDKFVASLTTAISPA
jgi:hypothetical protein